MSDGEFWRGDDGAARVLMGITDGQDALAVLIVRPLLPLPEGLPGFGYVVEVSAWGGFPPAALVRALRDTANDIEQKAGQ